MKMENKNFRTWLDAMELQHPLVIAGPCSAESEEQVLEIAHELKNTDATVFRAGVWKPRTRPGSFEGNGAIALPWLKKVKEETGLLTAIEIANAQHAKLALEFDIDILWNLACVFELSALVWVVLMHNVTLIVSVLSKAD